MPPYLADDVIIYRCAEGFLLVGTESSQCSGSPDFTWSLMGESVPQCLRGKSKVRVFYGKKNSGTANACKGNSFLNWKRICNNIVAKNRCIDLSFLLSLHFLSRTFDCLQCPGNKGKIVRCESVVKFKTFRLLLKVGYLRLIIATPSFVLYLLFLALLHRLLP